MSALLPTDLSGDVPVFAVENLAFGYTDDLLFRDVGFELQAGETLQLSGGSGTGKSTLLRVLARLQPCTTGVLRLNGETALDLPAQNYRRKVAYLQQLPVMLPGSVRDNLLLSYAYSDNSPPAEDELLHRLEHVGLQDVPLTQSAAELSIGQQQRIAVLRLLLMQPDVLLLDEPTASLDEASAAALLSSLSAAQKLSGVGLVHVTHQQRDGAPAPTLHGVLQHGTLEVRRV